MPLTTGVEVSLTVVSLVLCYATLSRFFEAKTLTLKAVYLILTISVAVGCFFLIT